MNTHKAKNTLVTAPPASQGTGRFGTPRTIPSPVVPGIQVTETKTISPNTHFDALAEGLSDKEIADLEARGVIEKLEGAQQDKPAPEMRRGNTTEGSGATGQGTTSKDVADVDSTGKAGPQQAGGAGSNLPHGKAPPPPSTRFPPT